MIICNILHILYILIFSEILLTAFVNNQEQNILILSILFYSRFFVCLFLVLFVLSLLLNKNSAEAKLHYSEQY